MLFKVATKFIFIFIYFVVAAVVEANCAINLY